MGRKSVFLLPLLLKLKCMRKIYFLFIGVFLFAQYAEAQVFYGTPAIYGLRKLVPTYAGSAIQVRRTCDNATFDVGFSCGDLDNAALTKIFITGSPLNAIASATDACFSVRLLRCGYAGKCMNVRRSWRFRCNSPHLTA
jgi:hypothetical protein